MKKLLLAFVLCLPVFGQNYVFLMQKQDNVALLEAKIVTKIANDIYQSAPKIFIFGSESTKDAFENFVALQTTCEEANFIFVKKGFGADFSKCNPDAIYFTDNKQFFKNNEIFAGSFYWLKSRPNIVFGSSRITLTKTKLPASYQQFIEDIE